MRQTFAGILILLCCALFWTCKPDRTFTEGEITIIPQVRKMTMGESSFRFKKSTKLIVESVDQEMIARQFAEQFEKVSGWKLQIRVGGNESTNQVYFKTELLMDPEAYTLEVTKNRIEIKAAKPAGFFYAMQTLRQLLPMEIERESAIKELNWLVPAVNISDGPTFKWRGFMLDVVRHFFPKEDLYRMIDNLALHKINTLHLHLTDDQGWRIEIKKHPRLTEVGGWRVDREDQPWNSRPKQEAGEKATYGGFYSQEDIRELVAYAQKRFITIVPEIEMPAHATAALASYPQYSCTGGPFTVPPGGVWPLTDIYCAGNDSTFLFLEEVLSEVMDLFPSKYIHIGGDEATKTEWEKCPKCRKRLKTEGLKSGQELQSYFTKRIEKFIQSKDRILMGWDEILEGGLPEKATVMSWRGFQGGIEAARLGHDVVMVPTSDCYFDYYQGPVDQEPLAIGGYIPLSRVYAFKPVPPELDSQAAKHILGGQANLWTEYVPNLKHAEYMAFPRMAAMAEVLWSPEEVRNWEDFTRRIQLFMERYDERGISYSKSLFSVLAKAHYNPEIMKLEVRLECEFPDAEIHFTTDGSEPTNLSQVYSEPILLNQTSTVKAIAFAGGNSSVKPFSQRYSLTQATGKPIRQIIPCDRNNPDSGIPPLVNGIHGSRNHQDGEWVGWEGKNMIAIIDIRQNVGIHHISVRSMQNSGSGIFFPQKVDFLISSDGMNFRKVGESLNDVDPLSGGDPWKEFSATFDTVSASYVKVVAYNPGKYPPGQVRGKDSWIFFDEIAIE